MLWLSLSDVEPKAIQISLSQYLMDFVERSSRNEVKIKSSTCWNLCSMSSGSERSMQVALSICRNSFQRWAICCLLGSNRKRATVLGFLRSLILYMFSAPLEVLGVTVPREEKHTLRHFLDTI